MAKNKVKFGLSNLHIAFLKNETGQGNPEWEAPIAIPGAVTISLNAAGGENPFYADNLKYFNQFADNGYTGSIETAIFPDEVLAEIQGWNIDTNGGVLEVTNGTQKHFALMAQIEGDQAGRRFVYYYCSGSKPAANASTIQENITPETDTMNLTVMPLKLDENRVATKYSITKTNENATVYDDFFKSVYVPNVG